MRTCTFHAPSGATLTFTALGQGCAPLGNLYRPISERQAQETLAAAWRAGIRYFDVAPLYGLGLAETRLNHFLRSRIPIPETSAGILSPFAKDYAEQLILPEVGRGL